MSDTEDKILNQVITEYVGKDEPFTAYGVYVEAKKRGATSDYNDLKQKIHTTAKHFVTAGVYNSTPGVETPTGKAILYHPPTYDPKSYFKKAGDGNNITI